MRILLLYHWFHPENVISARLFSDLARGLRARGWEVEASACNRAWGDSGDCRPLRESWNGIDIRRVWRPPLPQSSNLGRLMNAGWMVSAWSMSLAMRRRSMPDVVLVGTDPQFGVLVPAVVGRMRGAPHLVHWCHDVYPEAVVAHQVAGESSLAYGLARRLVKAGYDQCDLIADLGTCMRDRLARYGHDSRITTITPWALVEPRAVTEPDPEVRARLFGDARLGILYTGNFGRAHSAEQFLALARRLRGESIRFCFSVRGVQVEALRKKVGPDDSNITFSPFVPEEELPRHLASGDIHLASLASGWAGIAVPSKFFGSLAAGRPVIFAGPEESCLARWIREHRVGWVLNESSLPQIAAELQAIGRHPRVLSPLWERCHRVYRNYFSREEKLDQWDRELRALLAAGRRNRIPRG